MSDPQSVECAEHGTASASYICGHLFADPRQHWVSDDPSEEQPWPDAWCRACDAEYLKEGEWNERNEGCLGLRLVCTGCYESLLADSVDALSGDAEQRWTRAVCEAHEALTSKQQRLQDEFRINDPPRWDYDQSRGELVFSDGGKTVLIAEVEFIGSVSTEGGTWLWSWANFHLLPAVRSRIVAVRDFGIESGFPRLTVAKWAADEVDGWEVSGLAAQVLGAVGVYRALTDNGALFIALMSLRRV